VGSSVIASLVFEKPKFRKSFGDHQEISKCPPTNKHTEGRKKGRRRKSKPPDQEADRIIGRFRDRVQEGNILGAYRLEVVDETRR
jgi:hypothetical protein